MQIQYHRVHLMRQFFKYLSLLMFCFPLWAGAATGSAAVDTWYLKPSSTCANNGDGLAYNCAASAGASGAFNDATQVIWTGTTGVDDDDTLYICGVNNTKLTTAGNGTSGHQITVSFDCPNDSGSMVGATSVDYNVTDSLPANTVTARNLSMNSAASFLISSANAQNMDYIHYAGTWDAGQAHGANDITGDPLFAGGTAPTSPEGVRLTSISPLIGAGTCIARYTDYFGNWFKAPTCDIGAHSYTQNVRTTIETRN